MTERVQVKDSTSGATVWMWQVDAEEAVRYDPTRYVPQSPKPLPKKNPGGRGF